MDYIYKISYYFCRKCCFWERLVNISIIQFGFYKAALFACTFMMIIITIMSYIIYLIGHILNSSVFINRAFDIFYLIVSGGLVFTYAVPYLFAYALQHHNKELNKLLIFPSSLFIASKLGKIVGVNPFPELEKDHFWKSNHSVPVYEIHLNKKLSKTKTIEEINHIISKLPDYFAGSIIYTVTPINLEKRIHDTLMPHSKLIALKTKIDPEKAKKFRKDPSHFWFYLVKIDGYSLNP